MSTIYRHPDGRLRYRARVVVEPGPKFAFDLPDRITADVELLHPAASIDMPVFERGLRSIRACRTREVSPDGWRIFRA